MVKLVPFFLMITKIGHFNIHSEPSCNSGVRRIHQPSCKEGMFLNISDWAQCKLCLSTRQSDLKIRIWRGDLVDKSGCYASLWV